MLENIGDKHIKNAYIGLYVAPHVGFSNNPDDSSSSGDDLCGLLYSFESSSNCHFVDTVDIAWTADGDGDPFEGKWVEEPIRDPLTQLGHASVRGIAGVEFLTPSIKQLNKSFNWWAINNRLNFDFGPMMVDKYRDYKTDGTGSPAGDRNRYHVLRNGEIDYDVAYTSKYLDNLDWLKPPPQFKDSLAKGGTVEFLLSYGPIDITPGASFKFAFCVVAAEKFHLYPTNGDNLPNNPYQWYANVDFSGLAKNAVWADKIYDNPGVDTDGDGYAGESRICNLDSLFVDDEWIYTYADTPWYKGDGIPDWKAAGPPTPARFLADANL